MRIINKFCLINLLIKLFVEGEDEDKSIDDDNGARSPLDLTF